MKKLFGNKTTTLPKNKTLESVVSGLSNQALELLVSVAEKQEDGNLNVSRGVYVEYDSSECKPFSTKAFREVVNSGLVSVHPESEEGAGFLFMNLDVAKVLAEYGHFFTEMFEFEAA